MTTVEQIEQEHAARVHPDTSECPGPRAQRVGQGLSEVKTADGGDKPPVDMEWSDMDWRHALMRPVTAATSEYRGRHRK